MIEALIATARKGNTQTKTLLPLETLQQAINDSKTILAHDDNSDRIVSSIRRRIILNVLEKRRSTLSKDEDFFDLVKLIEESKSYPTLTYQGFKENSELAPFSTKRFFSAATFLMFPKNDADAISCDDFLRFVQRSMDVENTAMKLLLFAQEGNHSFLTEHELERYIYELIPEIPDSNKLHESFYPYYAYCSARRFFFFLDPKRTKRISIKKLAHSLVMEELLFLQRLSKRDGDFDVGKVNSNWFSGHNSRQVYAQFIHLDQDENGMLSVEEFMAYPGTQRDPAALTRTAVERIFEETITYRPMEMDYKAFLDFLLAMQNITSVEALSYFWRVLDVEKCGRLTQKNIEYFYKDVGEQLRRIGADSPDAAHVVIEVFDLLACNDCQGPTFNDFVRSGHGHTVAMMLLDVNGFWRYDNRENNMAHGNGGDDEGEEREDDELDQQQEQHQEQHSSEYGTTTDEEDFF